MSLRASVWEQLIRRLDESVRVLELRRYRRIISSGRAPVVYALAIFLVSGLLVPFLLREGGVLAGAVPISRYPAWWVGVLMVACSLGAGLAAYLRVQSLWHQERTSRTFHYWLMSYQSPPRAAITTIVMAALLGLSFVAVPAVFGLLLGIIQGLAWWQLLLYVLLVPLCALFGSALGCAVFFASYGLVSPALTYPALTGIALAAIGLWLRIESVQNGWHRGWEEHPARITQALSLVTPIPSLFGLAAPGWWVRYTLPSLGWKIGAAQGGMVYAGLLLAAALVASAVAVRGYVSLAQDPDQIEDKPRAPNEELGREFYWKGFGNPMLTRDIRTRLRSRDTTEFIFFASIAVAAGAFVPLVMTASDLSDPLQTAKAARQVFFWLTMTLVALVALIAPGLTADSVTHERATGSLEMLVATPLSPREILVGKLLGATAVLLLLISPSLPLFGLCYLFHGASGLQVVQVYVLIAVTLLIGSFIGVTQSAIHQKASSAKVFAYGTTAAFVAVPGGPFWIATATSAPSADLRQTLAGSAGLSIIIAVLAIFILGLFWGNACEQLEYSEY